MEQQIISFINDFGYFAIVILIALENVLPPIPSEIILTFAGFMTIESSLTIGGSVMAATVGAVLGALILYGAGTFLPVSKLKLFVDSRLGRFLHLKQSDIDNAQNFFIKHGNKTIFIGRFIPVIRSLISLPAGMLKMPWKIFIILTSLGTLIWNLVLIVLGRVAGEAWRDISKSMTSYSSTITITLVCLFLLGLIFFYFKRIKAK